MVSNFENNQIFLFDSLMEPLEGLTESNGNEAKLQIL